MALTEPKTQTQAGHILTSDETIRVKAAFTLFMATFDVRQRRLQRLKAPRPISEVYPPFPVIFDRPVTLVRLLECDFYIHTGGTEITAWNRKPTKPPKMPVAQAKRIRFSAMSFQYATSLCVGSRRCKRLLVFCTAKPPLISRNLTGHTIGTTSKRENLTTSLFRKMSKVVNRLQPSLNIPHISLRLRSRNLTHHLPPNHYKSSISSLKHAFYKTHWFSPIKKASHHSELTRYVRPVFTERNSLRCKTRYTVSGCIPIYSAASFAVNHFLIPSITTFLERRG
nr:MAG TPA: hypothetical protein [Caudoviricetes sp.]